MFDTLMGQKECSLNKYQSIPLVVDTIAKDKAVISGQRQLLHTMFCRQEKHVGYLLIRGGTVSPGGVPRE